MKRALWQFPPRRTLLPAGARPRRALDVDLLIIGTGAAALRAAAEVPRRRSALIVTKHRAIDSNTSKAQGGVAAAIAPGDTVASHVRDTLETGRGLADPDVVRLFITEGAECVRELYGWGADFDPGFALEGGHSRSRVVHRGDRTGAEVGRVLLDRARGKLMEEAFAVDLVVEDGRCVGAVLWKHGFIFVRAGATILATGGAGQVFRETTNPDVATGDGVAMAFRAGAELMDLEFMQFHPTALYLAGASRALISEAVRGAGAVIRDARGKTFLGAYDPRAELAPRDVVSRSILKHMIAHGDTEVYLDLTPIPAARLKRGFPGLCELCAEFGLNVRKDPIPVRPAAHYWIGGVRTDAWGATSIPGLFAAGECAATGFHGANRLASNSLLECLVMGRRAARRALAMLDERGAAPARRRFTPPKGRHPAVEPFDIGDLRSSLKSLMWRWAGVERSREGLEGAIERLSFWSSYALVREFGAPPGWELQNLLTVGGLIASAALLRQETRGVHFRADFPKARLAEQLHRVLRREGSSLRVAAERVRQAR